MASDENNIFPVSQEAASLSNSDNLNYKKMYVQSIDNPEKFWSEQASMIDWIKPWTKVKNTSFDNEISIKWFENAKLNVCVNCVDRHLPERADQTAIIWEGDDPKDDKYISYRELHEQTSRLANVLRSHGIKKGDRVTIYMPMIPEATYAMLACARIGAIHSVVFGGFSPDSLADRIIDCKSTCVITADEGIRGGKNIPLKNNTDNAIKNCPDVKTVMVVKRTSTKDK